MGFKYSSRDASNCLPAGDYDAMLESVTEKTSTKGNPMLEIVWMITTRDGRDVPIKDFIVNPSTVFKLQGIAQAWGMGKTFDDETFDLSEHIGKVIGLRLTIKPAQGDFREQNNIKSYMSPNTVGPAAAKEADASIPF